MFDFLRPASRPAVLALVVVASLATALPATAADHAAHAAPSPTITARKPIGDDSRDPLDIVRERLAAKLGAIKAPDAASPDVVRVVSKAGTGSAPTVPSMRGAARVLPAAASNGGAPAHRHGDANPWSYAGTGGPDAWGRLDAAFSACTSGSRQSPIDIRDGIRVDLDPVHFDYKPTAFRVVDTGHTVQVNLAPGNSIEVGGRRYELLQFHFHRPSEERVNGRLFDMVAHLVHKDVEGRLAVVAVLLDRGSAQPVLQAVWNNLPLEKGDEVPARLPLDVAELLPPDRSYYTYMGSLTTPPCSEGVLWMVMKQPVPIAPEQVAIFARLYPMNARPIQSASGRLIKESN